MHTLAELNPKVGDEVIYTNQYGCAKSAFCYTVLGRSKEGWRLSDIEGVRFTEKEYGFYANKPNWTLKPKPQPKEPMKTVAELNLKVGDRIQSGDRTGTYIGWDQFSTCEEVDVIWDWHGCEKLEPTTPVDWTLLPKPEPTLASLGLKVGDPVLINYAVWLVNEMRKEEVLFICSTGVTQKYPLSKPLTEFSQIKKIEVPK